MAHRASVTVLRESHPLIRRHISLSGQHSLFHLVPRSSGYHQLPRLVQPSIWRSIIPKALRNWKRKPHATEKKEPNPASYFIWIYLFIGSQAIRILGVQNEFNNSMRKAELKIWKLREVIKKIQDGEEVDVEKELGTGDTKQELEWEEALKEIENEDKIWQNNRKKTREEKQNLEVEQQEASPINQFSKSTSPAIFQGASERKIPGFF